MGTEQSEQMKTIQERMAEEGLGKERVDEEGNRWTKVYFGGGQHFRKWLEQCKELGEKAANQQGIPCSYQKCSKCETAMTRG